MTRKQPQPLTPNEKKVLEYLEAYISKKGFAPTYQEIRGHFGFASFNSVQRYLKQLEDKGYVYTPGDNKKRAIRLLHPASAVPSALQKRLPGVEALSLPLLGRVAAGKPIEEVEENEFFETPSSLVRQPGKTFALRVKGQSMKEDGILDGDVILVQRQNEAANGEIVVALVNNEATVKRFYFQSNASLIELRPSNSAMQSLWYRPEEVRIQGILVGLIRRF